VSEQTYTSSVALARIRAGQCPECGEAPETHGNDNRFWMPVNHSCDLMEAGVRNRIGWQLGLDAAAACPQAGAPVRLTQPVTWCGETHPVGTEFVVHAVHPYPPDLGGPVLILNWPGTSPSDYGPHVHPADVGDLFMPVPPEDVATPSEEHTS
jgi:hypothetical protein